MPFSYQGKEALYSTKKYSKSYKYTLGKNPENLTTHQQSCLEEIRELYPKMFRGYQLKEGLRKVFQSPQERVEEELKPIIILFIERSETSKLWFWRNSLFFTLITWILRKSYYEPKDMKRAGTKNKVLAPSNFRFNSNLNYFWIIITFVIALFSLSVFMQI